ncbi:uncharacterized protein DNG_08665 [Cephalotrichum gorgonifer]|uniref:Uncharacterized protein n=1 Tax=Cephalotrichum gorgonifer TaxID=2041049 RepID=A0AAE8N3Z9_9PEZI|nr:uncharacterized protein DNG_08665 [Cephalotrichum gorgonifer]
MGLWPDDSSDDYQPSLPGSEGYGDEDDHVLSPLKLNLALHSTRSDNAGSDGHGYSDSGSLGDDGERPAGKRRKRRLPPDFGLPQGRLPFKRVPGLFNQEYISLLNDDIDDIKEQVIAEGGQTWTEPSQVLPLPLPTSQIGMVVWTGAEKRLFFDALGRLGKDSLPGISSRIGTKSIVEVAQYIRLLEQTRREKRIRTRDAVIPAEIPAAAEISPQCCLALEAAADELSLRQQRYEEKREQQRWEDFPWNITREAASKMEEEPGQRREPFADLFRLPAWLKLSDRVFMNASFAENNWRSVDEEPPSIRSTALQDFHNLTVSITRRIVSAALFCAASRIGAKAVGDGRTRNLVKRGDVLAAVESLGLARDSNVFWAKCARRLKLDVYDDEDDEPNEDGRLPILAFDEVEAALGVAGQPQPSTEPADGDSESEADELTEGEEDADATDTETELARTELEEEEEALERELEEEIEEEEVREEARELINYTALGMTNRSINTVKHRIVTERNHEAYADACDEVASAKEELRLWEVLRLEPPEELARKVREVERVGRENISTDDYLKRGEWRDGLRYLSSGRLCLASDGQDSREVCLG